jgi:hypothetical protein
MSRKNACERLTGVASQGMSGVGIMMLVAGLLVVPSAPAQENCCQRTVWTAPFTLPEGDATNWSNQFAAALDDGFHQLLLWPRPSKDSPLLGPAQAPVRGSPDAMSERGEARASGRTSVPRRPPRLARTRFEIWLIPNRKTIDWS